MRDPRLADSLDPLPGDLPMRELVIDDLPRSHNLVGVERWDRLERVAVRGIPSAEEIAALARLSQLAQLTIHSPETAPDRDQLQAALPGVSIELTA